MKKLFAFAAIATLFLATSCKKDYTCTVAGQPVTYTKLTKSQADTQETACKNVGGTWAKK